MDRSVRLPADAGLTWPRRGISPTSAVRRTAADMNDTPVRRGDPVTGPQPAAPTDAPGAPGDRRLADRRHLHRRDVRRDHGAARRPLRRRSVARRDEPLRERLPRTGDERRVLRVRRVAPSPSASACASAIDRRCDHPCVPGADGPRRPRPARGRRVRGRPPARPADGPGDHPQQRRGGRVRDAGGRHAAVRAGVPGRRPVVVAAVGVDGSRPHRRRRSRRHAAGAGLGVVRRRAAGARRRRPGLVPGHGGPRPAPVVRCRA